MTQNPVKTCQIINIRDKTVLCNKGYFSFMLFSVPNGCVTFSNSSTGECSQQNHDLCLLVWLTAAGFMFMGCCEYEVCKVGHHSFLV